MDPGGHWATSGVTKQTHQKQSWSTLFTQIGERDKNNMLTRGREREREEEGLNLLEDKDPDPWRAMPIYSFASHQKHLKVWSDMDRKPIGAKIGVTWSNSICLSIKSYLERPWHLRDELFPTDGLFGRDASSAKVEQLTPTIVTQLTRLC